MELHLRFLRYVDVVAVFFLAIFPDLVNSTYAFTSTGQRENYSFSYIHAYLIARSLQVSAPILLIMFLRKINWSDYGFKRVRPVRDTATAIGLVVLCYMTYILVYNVIVQLAIEYHAGAERAEAMIRGMSPESTIAFLIMLLSSIANGFAEELALRSYLIPRLFQLLGSKLLAVLITSSLFGAYHLYQGILGATSAFVIGIVFGTYFVAKRRFWPVAIAHIAMDIIPQVFYLMRAEH